MKYMLTLTSALLFGLVGLTGCPADDHDDDHACETDADCDEGEHCHVEDGEGHCEAEEEGA